MLLAVAQQHYQNRGPNIYCKNRLVCNLAIIFTSNTTRCDKRAFAKTSKTLNFLSWIWYFCVTYKGDAYCVCTTLTVRIFTDIAIIEGNMEGSCNCKEVKFTTSSNIKAILNCHCGLCRKANGSAFSTYVVFPSSDFALKSGALKTVQISKNASKSFCSQCGSPIFNENPKYTGLKIVYLGALDNAEHLKPVVDTYCESQLAWLDDMATLKKMEQGFA
jgi:hypothetical protein